MNQTDEVTRKFARRIAVAAAAAVLGLGAALYAAGPSVQAQGVDIEAVFWCTEPQADGDMPLDQCAEARDAILYHCTACHTFVPIVKAQKSEEEWNATLMIHRDRVDGITNDELQLIRQYVVTHYNPDQPVPTLPPELENLGTNQAF